MAHYTVEVSNGLDSLTVCVDNGPYGKHPPDVFEDIFLNSSKSKIF